MGVFLDTNILLDVPTRRAPFYEHSARLWTLAEEGKIQGLVSTLSFANCFYIVNRLASRRAAQRAMALLRGAFQPVAFDTQILNQATDSDFKDMEDAVQLFSALRSDAQCFVTRNPRHFPTDRTAIQTPTEFLSTHFPA